MGTFDELNSVNCNEFTETIEQGKTALTYLTWSKAWAEVKKRFPEATYKIWKDEAGRPYTYDELTGFMCYTEVTINGITHEMWLPVLNGANKAMKAQPYTYTVKDYRGNLTEKTVEAATMFDVNKTIMRCLTKNLAMHGLGLYIYAGEDLPEGERQEKPARKTKQDERLEEADLKAKVIGYINRHKYTKEEIDKVCELYGVQKLTELNKEHLQNFVAFVESKGGKISA